MEWPISSAALWSSALAVVPVALVCGCICRILPLAPASKHGLWLATLLAFVLPLILPNAPSLPTSTMLVLRPAASHGETPASDAESLESSLTVDQPLEKVTSPSGVASPTIQSPVAIKPAPAPRAAQPAIKSDGAAGEAESTVLCAGAGSEDESENNEDWTVASWTSAATYTADQPTAIQEVPHATASPAKPRTLSTERRSNVWRDAREAAGEWMVIWSIVLNDVRAWIARLPGLPLPVWLCGIAALLAVQMARFAIFARRLRGAIPAPTIVQRSVSEVCAALGLSRTPRTLLVDQRVSPMIVPGLRPRLVLPMRLWAQLDKHGRRAILCHELAHLRRRDHWVCWIEQAVSLIYWWHPLVWWVRRRMHEEADLACDAWVTWLMPQRRRAYAEALLCTKQFVALSRATAPVGGMAAATGRARNFARRLTMVMTTSVSPRRTMTGLLTAASLAAAGWATAPAWSCPEDKAQSKTTGETKSETKCQTITVCQDAAAPAGQACAPAAAADQVGVTFCAPSAATAAPAWGVSGGGKGAGAAVGGVYVTSPAPPAALYTIALNSTQSQDDDVSAKLARLEKQLQELQNALAEVRAGTGTGPRPAPFVGGRADRASEHALKLFAQGIATGGRSTESLDTLATAEGPVVIRQYSLNEGKLEALYALLVRDDVPIRVRIDGDKLEVHATEGQHRIFSAFLKMLNSGEASHGATWTPAPTPRGATGRRTLTETKSAPSPRVMRQLEELRALGKTQGAAVAELKNSGAWREMLKAQGDDAKLQLKSLKDSLRNAARTSQAEGSAMQAEAERLAEAAQEQAEKAASMLDNAASMKNIDAARAKALEQAAKELEKKARELEKKVQQLEKRARTKDRETSRAEEQAEELEELLDSPDIAAETVDVMEGVEIPVIDVPGIETTAPDVEVDLPEIEVVVPPVEIPDVPPAEPSKAALPAAPSTPAPPATPAPAAPTPR